MNRKDVSPVIKSATVKPGNPSVFVHHDGVTYISWTDKRQVNLATTIHDDSLYDRQQCQRHQAQTVLVCKPVAVELYTRFMGGVDRADQLTWNLLLWHRTNKWYIKLFLYLFEVTLVNTHIIYSTLNPTMQLKRLPTSSASRLWKDCLLATWAAMSELFDLLLTPQPFA